MDNLGESVNESVESSFHTKETKENTSPAGLKNAWSIRTWALLNFFVASLGWFLSLLFLPVAYFKNAITTRRKKRSKDPKTARVFVINDLSSCDKLLQFHRSKYPFKMNYIGMDCEWVNKKGQVNAPVALLQIATPLCDCYLVRLCKMDGEMPQIVKEILEDKTVLKFGVGIQNDAKRLLEMFAIHVRGCVDLRRIAQRTQLENGDQSGQKMSLDALAKRILGVKLNKSSRIQCSNWEEERLSAQQIEYAMNDALVASHIFLMLVKKARKSLDSEDFASSQEMFNFRDFCNEDEGTNQSSSIRNECYRVDLSKFETDEMAGYLSSDEVIGIISDPHFTQRAGLLCQDVIDVAFKGNALRPAKSNKSSKKGTTRKSPLYMNCMLTAPDGSRLCGVNLEKADWYINKGLGHKTNDDPYTVQLNFEPARRPGTKDHCLNCNLNICVVCGDDESYMRKNVVPHDYRRYFPLVMKDNHSHDILLTCPRCHSLANVFDDQLRKELAIKYNAPLASASVSHLVEDPKLRKVKSAAKALSHAGDRIPEARRQELSLIVQKHFSASALTLEMISEAATMETRKENANFVSHGFVVVKRVRAEGTLLEFEKMWRKHFVDKMKPKFLPPSWSVDHRHETLKGKLTDCPDHL